MKRKSRINRITGIFLAALLALLSVGVPVRAEEPENSLGNVVFAVENFTIGQGYLVEPVLVPIEEEDTYATILLRALGERGYVAEYTGDAVNSFYLRGIQGADTGVLDIPACIQKMPRLQNAAGEWIDPPDNTAVNEYGTTLNEFSYNNMAGWYYSVNNVAPNEGMAGYKTPEDGDVFRVMFTVYGYGRDVVEKGSFNSGNPSYDKGYTVADKTELTRIVARANAAREKWQTAENFTRYYQGAMDCLMRVDAAQDTVDLYLRRMQALEASLPATPTALYFTEHSLELFTDSEAYFLGAMAEPGNADLTGLAFESADPSVAEVDGSGWVTPVGTGSVDITVRLPGGLWDTCRVTVKDRPMKEVQVSPASWSMETGETKSLSVTWTPGNTTDSTEMTWESGDEDVAVVDGNGTVTGVGDGETDITVRFANGLTASCHVTVSGDARALADAMAGKIRDLPDPGNIKTIGDIQAVKALYEEYEGLPETARKWLEKDGASMRRLTACLEAAGKLEASLGESMERIAAVRDAIEVLPVLSGVLLQDAPVIEAARSLYEGLSPLEKEQVSDLLPKLRRCESRLAELREEQTDVKEALAALPRPVTLKDWQSLADIHEKLQSVGQGALDEEERAEYAAAGKQMAAAIETACRSLAEELEKNPSMRPDTGNGLVKTFLSAWQAYNGLPLEIQNQVPAGGLEAMRRVQDWIAGGISGDTATGTQMKGASWYIRLIAEAGGKEQKESDEALLEERLAGRRIKVQTVLGIRWEDVRDGSAYVPEKALSITIPAREYSDLMKSTGRKPELYYIEAADGAPVVKRLYYTYEEKDGALSFRLGSPGQVILADVEVPLTGIALPGDTRVGVDSTVQFAVFPVPADASVNGQEVTWAIKDTSVAKVTGDGKVTGLKEGTTTLTATAVTGEGGRASASCKVLVTSGASGLSVSLGDVMTDAKAWMLKADTNPTAGSEWFVLGLARSGMNQDSDYFSTYYNHVTNYLKEKNGILDTVKYTEYSRTALAMTAIGKDARNVGGYNLLTPLADMDKLTDQGINSVIFALIASNCSPEYDIPKADVRNQATKEKLVAYILDAQLADGSWRLGGQSGQDDPDITAMALQALAPYYRKGNRSDVNQAVERSLSYLGRIQLSSGGYSYWNDENSESTAQVITALCALGIDPAADARFIKNGHWTVEALLAYRTSEGGFRHVMTGRTNGMATEQAYYALAAYSRLLTGKTSLYDMSDMTLKAGAAGDGKGTGLENGTARVNASGRSTGTRLSTRNSTRTGTSARTSTGTRSGTSVTGRSGGDNGRNAAEESVWDFGGETYVPGESSWGEDIPESGVPLYGGRAVLGARGITADGESMGPVISAAVQAAAALMAVRAKRMAVPYVLCIFGGTALCGLAIYIRKRQKMQL